MSGSTTIGYTGQIITYVAPVTATYTITADGGSGGDGGYGSTGGLAAEVSGTFTLTAGEVLWIVVGGAGSTYHSGSGGGGSYVVAPGNTPLLIAGGGGGGGEDGTANGTNGGLTSTGNGSGGSGGGAATNQFSDVGGGGGGGGGFNGNGLAGAAGSSGEGTEGGGAGGASFLNGAAGGNSYEGPGGFGGGASAGDVGGGGGGGGYNGGAGGYGGSDTQPKTGGQGGTSYDIGTNQSFKLAPSGNGSVTITPGVVLAQPSTISGTVANQPITDATTLYAALSGVTITDPNPVSPTETVTVTPSATANGTLSDSVGTVSNGVYTVSGSATYVTTALQALKFTPTAHQVAPGQTVTTTFTIKDVNSLGFTSTDSKTSVIATAVGQASTIAGTVAGQTTTDVAPPKAAFSGVTITDPNLGSPTETVTVTPSATANGTLSDSVGGTVSNGVYTVSGSAASVTSALQALTFTPTAHQVAPGQTVTTSFTIKDVNSAGVTSTDSTTSVIATAVAVPLTLKQPVLTYTVPEGQTKTGLYQALVQNVQDANFGAQISIDSIGQPNTMGFAYLNSAGQLLSYTASGFNPNAAQPADSFTYTASDQYGQKVTGTVAVNVTGPSRPTQVGTNLTANGAGQRLVGGNGNDTLTANGANQLIFGSNGNDTIRVNGAASVIYGGTGTNTIQINGSQQTIVLQQAGLDTITGFNLNSGDVLDLRQALAETNTTNVQVTSTGNNATLSLGGSALATLVGVGPGVTLQTLIDHGALKTA